MDLALQALTAPTNGPSVIGALCAAGIFATGNQNYITQKIKKLFQLSSNSIRTKVKKLLILSSFRKSQDNLSVIHAPVPSSHDVRRVLEFCSVPEHQDFSSALSYWKQATAVKISEGFFNEVYKFNHADGSPRIFKCMPVDGLIPTSQLPNLPLERVLQDIVCSTHLSKLNEGPVFAAPNFPKVFSICLVKDRLPETMVNSWLEYQNSPARLNGPSLKLRPDLYHADQTFLTVESSYDGIAADKILQTLQDAWVGVSILTQLVSALAVAEEAFRFEHRDLSLSNIVIKRTEAVRLRYSIRNLHFAVKIQGHQVCVIDFNMSRISVDGKVYNMDEKYFEFYQPRERVDWMESRWMYFNEMLLEDGFERNAARKNCSWEEYSPRTTIVFLKYLIETILKSLQRNNPEFMSLVPSPEDVMLEPNNVDHMLSPGAANNNHMSALSAETTDQMLAMRLLFKWNSCVLKHDSAKEFLDDVILARNPLVSVVEL